MPMIQVTDAQLRAGALFFRGAVARKDKDLDGFVRAVRAAYGAQQAQQGDTPPDGAPKPSDP